MVLVHDFVNLFHAFQTSSPVQCVLLTVLDLVFADLERCWDQDQVPDMPSLKPRQIWEGIKFVFWVAGGWELLCQA